jgi:transcriptional/translational regulatory protein YebC/TACO1
MEADVDVSDIECEDGNITVFAPNTEYFKAKQAIEDAFGETDYEVNEIQFIPQAPAPLSEEDQAALDKFIDMLEYLEDVQNVYHNVG